MLLQRGEDVEWKNVSWSPERGAFRLTVGTDERLFWRTFRELYSD